MAAAAAGAGPAPGPGRPAVPAELGAYLRRAGEALLLPEGFPGTGEQVLFVENVLTEVRGHELPVAMDPVLGPLLERLLEAAGAGAAGRVLAALRAALLSACTHRSAAHVLQTALTRCSRVAQAPASESGGDARQRPPRKRRRAVAARDGDEQEDGDEEGDGDEQGDGDVVRLHEEVVGIAEALGQDDEEEEEGPAGVAAGLEEEEEEKPRGGRFLRCARDVRGSHVLRSLLQVLGGVALRSAAAGAKHTAASGATTHKGEGRGSQSDAAPVLFPVPPSFRPALRSLITHGLLPNLLACIHEEAPALVLQTALLVLHTSDPKLGRRLCTSLLDSLTPSSVLTLMKDRVGSRVLERIVEVGNPKLLRRLHKEALQGKLLPLALHPLGNFVVQRLLQCCSEKLFPRLCSELVPAVEEIMAEGHMGVVTRIAQAAGRLGVLQKECLQQLLAAFHCAEKSRRKSCALPFACLVTWDMLYGESGTEQPESFEVNYHGSVLLQVLLGFSEPALVSSSLLGLPSAQLSALCCCAAGSHVIDAFMGSGTVSRKHKGKLLQQLKDQLRTLATNKHGSRVLDRLWAKSGVKQREEVAQELAACWTDLRRDPIGRFVVRNLCLENFVRRPVEWRQHQASQEKKRKALSEILE
ncbi:LOW QUALITY PROTEIN: nucleolar protein 9 [Lethenteron reissneri]|uniref:LOW QUALITY PROTEIN: nucleolar protein 9 n=1 Tax=Lethenteron reissneri TaxID=7753 RepID=UPI002AB7C1D5|nr:LOW QUALITY PROTEIN: nucleolar protein 9 [Lethenteron reissneri]